MSRVADQFNGTRAKTAGLVRYFAAAVERWECVGASVFIEGSADGAADIVKIWGGEPFPGMRCNYGAPQRFFFQANVDRPIECGDARAVARMFVGWIGRKEALHTAAQHDRSWRPRYGNGKSTPRDMR